jgi:hypothetical protein
MLPCRRALAVLALLCAPVPACAQDPAPGDDGWELGGRYWWSVGRTQWSHNAQRVAPILGNPTSVLVYDRLYAHSLELTGTKRWRQGWFISGHAGVGKIYGGNLNDSDYFAGQVKFSETDSSVSDGYLAYLTVDGGHDIWGSAGGSALGLFGGLQYWTEEVEASGLSYRVNPGGQPNIGNGVRVITNEVTWISLRAGLAARIQMSEKSRFLATFAFVPHTEMSNNDSHHLRTASNDLGPAPNITMEGTGSGLQLDAEARYAVRKGTELGLGLRYWRLTAEGTVKFGRGSSLPLKEFESTRRGVTLAIVNRW